MGRMREEVDAALSSAEVADRDAGAVALVYEYADLIDDAGVPGKYTEALEWLEATGTRSGDRDADKHVRKIVLALAKQSVVSDLGPKLLASMEALQLTPRARAAAVKPSDRNGAASPLDELRARRRRAGKVG